MLRDRENRAAAFLESRGLMVSRPGDGIEESGLKWQWGVYTGSHGGHGKTLRGAMGECLKCCGIGRWWTINGQALSGLLSEARENYLRRGRGGF